MRDPYTPPAAPSKDIPASDNPKRPASVTWAMVLCGLWVIMSYPVFRTAQKVGIFDWLLGIICAVVLFAIFISFAAPRSRIRQRAIAAVYILSLLRVAQTILAFAKNDPASITAYKITFWVTFTALFAWGLLRVLAGHAALRYFNSKR